MRDLLVCEMEARANFQQVSKHLMVPFLSHLLGYKVGANLHGQTYRCLL